MLVIKENYPFSHFPMYSRNSEKTYVIYITDGKDRPIVYREQFGRSVIRPGEWSRRRGRTRPTPRVHG